MQSRCSRCTSSFDSGSRPASSVGGLSTLAIPLALLAWHRKGFSIDLTGFAIDRKGVLIDLKGLGMDRKGSLIDLSTLAIDLKGLAIDRKRGDEPGCAVWVGMFGRCRGEEREACASGSRVLTLTVAGRRCASVDGAGGGRVKGGWAMGADGVSKWGRCAVCGGACAESGREITALAGPLWVLVRL